MAGWIEAVLVKRCPKAKRCVDPFHVIALAGEALDEIRREVWRRAKKPCHAFVDGLPDTRFEIEPVFVAGLTALWGRADLMMNFTIGISEKNRELTLQPD